MYKGIGGSSGYGIGKIVIIKNDMPVYEIKSPENKENEIKRYRGTYNNAVRPVYAG